MWPYPVEHSILAHCGFACDKGFVCNFISSVSRRVRWYHFRKGLTLQSNPNLEPAPDHGRTCAWDTQAGLQDSNQSLVGLPQRVTFYHCITVFLSPPSIYFYERPVPSARSHAVTLPLSFPSLGNKIQPSIWLPASQSVASLLCYCTWA